MRNRGDGNGAGERAGIGGVRNRGEIEKGSGEKGGIDDVRNRGDRNRAGERTGIGDTRNRGDREEGKQEG